MKARRWPVRLAWVAVMVVVVVGPFTENSPGLPLNLLAVAAGLVLLISEARR